MARIKRDPKTVALAKKILETYNPKTVHDMDEALKDIFSPLFENMLQGEIDNHLGYKSNDRRKKTIENRRNSYTSKK